VRFAEVWRWAESGLVKPHIGRAAPLSEWKSLMLAKWKGDIVGGAVLNP
jgi:NADPH2:quinone reductase